MSPPQAGPPGPLSLPRVPSLEHDPDPETNTLAILLPHQAFFAPAALQILKDAFSAYGSLAHWAPVRAMGRVIAVYTRDEDAAAARREADGLKLDVALEDVDDDSGRGKDNDKDKDKEGKEAKSVRPEPEIKGKDDGYFSKTHSRKSSRASDKGFALRVYALPPTALDSEPDHLRPPEHDRNFLISPPGSPPEGWAPIVEEGPNMAPLADDLRRALEALQLQAERRHGGGGPSVILDEGGVRVEVEDTGAANELDKEWGEEYVTHGGEEMWEAPRQRGPALGMGMGGGMGVGLGGPGGPLTPAGRIMPTAMPPRQSE